MNNRISPFTLILGAALTIVAAIGFSNIVAQSYDVTDLHGPEQLQAVVNALETRIQANESAITNRLELSGGTITGDLVTATNSYIVLNSTTNSPGAAGAIAVVSTNLYVSDGTNWSAIGPP
jgi:hypothetical protein